MPLAAGEVLEAGGVRDAYGRRSLTASSGALPAGAYWSGGFLRDSDGRVLVVIETLDAAASAGSYISGGYRRDSLGRLCVAQASGALSGGQRLSGGEIRDAQGRLVLAGETLGAALSAGDFLSGGIRDSYGRRAVAGLTPPVPALVTAILADTPVAYFQQTADTVGTTMADSSGNGHDGTYVSAPARDASGVHFVSASGDYAKVSGLPAISDVFSLECFFTPDVDTDHNLIILGDGSGGLVLGPSGVLRAVKAFGPIIAQSANGTVPIGDESHLVVTKNGATIKQYIDGVDVTANVANAVCVAHTVAAFGAWTTDGNAFGPSSDGVMRHAAIYDHELSAARVAAHFAAA